MQIITSSKGINVNVDGCNVIVAPFSVSEELLASPVLMQMCTLGRNEEEIGFVISSSYEYKNIPQHILQGTGLRESGFIYESVDEAIAILFGPLYRKQEEEQLARDLEERKTRALEEVEQMRSDYGKMSEELESLRTEYTENKRTIDEQTAYIASLRTNNEELRTALGQALESLKEFQKVCKDFQIRKVNGEWIQY